MDNLKYCYSLSELAQKWGKSENDILHMAAQNKLWLSVNLTDYQPDNINGIKINLCLSPYEKPYFDGKEIKAWLPPVPIEGWWQLLIPSEIAGFLPNREESYFTCFRNPKENTYRIIRTSDKKRVSFKIGRGNLFIMADEVERFEIENPSVIAQRSNKKPESIQEQPSLTTSNVNQKEVNPLLENRTAKSNNHRKMGRHLSPLREAVEYLYRKLHDSGHHECLRPGKIRLFLEEFRAMVRKDDYIAERVEKILISGGKWQIKTQEITAREDSRRVVMQKSKTYSQNEISKILNELRKKKPIE